jgi:multidrug efflux pump subunit AcrB
VTNVKDLEAVPLKKTEKGAVFRPRCRHRGGWRRCDHLLRAREWQTHRLPAGHKRAEASTLDVVKTVREKHPRVPKAAARRHQGKLRVRPDPGGEPQHQGPAQGGRLGAILTGLMVLVFLRDLRTAFIVIINIPLSLLAATFGLWISGQNIHLMTLGGLALAVGILVDEATVTVENIHTHLGRGKSLARAALDGTLETTCRACWRCFASSRCSSLPFSWSARPRRSFVPLALAVGFAMFASFILSSTLVPVLSVWLLPKNTKLHDDKLGLIARMYGKASSKRLSRAAGSLCRPISRAAMIVVSALGRSSVQRSSRRRTAASSPLRFRAPSGTQVAITEGIAQQILTTIATEAGGKDKIEMSIGMVGVHNSSYPVNLVHLWNGGPEEGWLAVQMRPDSGVRIEPFQERLREVFAQSLPDVRLSFEPQDIVSRVMSFGSPTPIEIAVSGPSLPASKEHAEKILAKLKDQPFLRDVQIAQTLDAPTVNVQIDRERAGLLGVTVEDVTRSLVAATTSSRFTQPVYWADPKTGISFNLQVQIPEERTKTIEDLANMPVTSANGAPVLLRNIAKIDQGTAVGTYERYNLVRVASITANIHDIDFGSAIAKVRALLEEIGPAPDGKTRVDVRGQIIPYNQLYKGFSSGLVIAIIVIFLLLCANFQSLRLALVVISTMPAVLAGVVLALFFTGTTINIQSAMGAIMAVGVAVANAILARHLRGSCASRPQRRLPCRSDGRCRQPPPSHFNDQLCHGRWHDATRPRPR